MLRGAPTFLAQPHHALPSKSGSGPKGTGNGLLLASLLGLAVETVTISRIGLAAGPGSII